MLELNCWRDRNSKRETRVLGILGFIVGTVFKSLFGKPADSLEKGVSSDDECKETDRKTERMKRKTTKGKEFDVSLGLCSLKWLALTGFASSHFGVI